MAQLDSLSMLRDESVIEFGKSGFQKVCEHICTTCTIHRNFSTVKMIECKHCGLNCCSHRIMAGTKRALANGKIVITCRKCSVPKVKQWWETNS
jgi:hypothetical protein